MRKTPVEPKRGKRIV